MLPMWAPCFAIQKMLYYPIGNTFPWHITGAVLLLFQAEFLYIVRKGKPVRIWKSHQFLDLPKDWISNLKWRLLLLMVNLWENVSPQRKPTTIFLEWLCLTTGQRAIFKNGNMYH